jgi:hypothetical protein
MRALVAATLLVSVASPRARADEGPQPLRVTSVLLSHPGVDEAQTVPVMRAIGDGLKKNSHLEMKDLESRLADFEQDAPAEQVAEARKLAEEGQASLAALELPQAIKKLDHAVDALSKVLPHIKKQELADAMMALGAAHWLAGDKKAAHAILLKLFTWRSDYRLDTQKFPPALIPPVEEARKEVEKAKRGGLEIRSEPPAAQAYVDGRFVGVTPAFADALPVGEHFVTLKREGYRKAVMPGMVSARELQVLNVKLERSSKYLLVEQALAGVERSLGAAQLDATADNLRDALFIDHAVFVRVAPSAQAGSLDVSAFLYDLRNRHLLSKMVKSLPAAAAEKQLTPVASSLYLNVSYEDAEAPKDAPVPKRTEKTRRAFYKTWWFWTVSAAVVGGVVAAAVATPRPKVCASGAWCGQIQF